MPASNPTPILAVMKGRFFSILEKKPRFSLLASSLKRPTSISIPSVLFAKPSCELSSEAINTFLIPYFLIASEQGGVLPVVEQGSRVTYISEFSSADSAFEPRFLNTSCMAFISA